MSDCPWKSTHIDTGDEWWTVCGHQGRIFELDRAKKIAKELSGLVEHFDTRLSVREVMRLIKVQEKVFGNVPEDDNDSTGPWDEYASPERDGSELWPTYAQMTLRVNFGGSEGIYMDASYYDHKAETHKHLFTMKTCTVGSTKWSECWDSAKRIAWYLQDHCSR